MKSIPYGRQYVTEEDIQAVVSVLRSDYLTQGPKIKEFEEAFAAYTGSKYAVAVSSGTAALHLSALALEVTEGSRVITTPITFAASANCVMYCNGEIIFSDIDSETYLLDLDKVRDLLSSNPKEYFQGLIVVDFAGRAVNLDEYRALADEYGLWIIEDACHAPGGYFTSKNGQKNFCGNGQFAELSIFSFHPVKHIAAGEGGMITTNDKALYNRLYKLRTHGITKSPGEFMNSAAFAVGMNDTGTRSDYPDWYMELQELGYNYRITDIQAALGISQLKRAEENLKVRQKIAKKYERALSELNRQFGSKERKPVKKQPGFVEGHAYHLYVIEVEDRIGLYNHLRENNILSQIHYIPLHLMPFYRRFGWKYGDLPVSEKYYEGCLSLPIYPTLSDSEQELIIDKIVEYYTK